MIFDELEFATRLLKTGFSRYKSISDLFILAKYYRHLGMNKKEVEKELLNFCYRFNPEFNVVTDGWRIDNAVNNSQKYKLRQPIDINVTQQELATIEQIDNYKYQKILFVMLVCSKNERYNGTKIKPKKNKSTDFFVNSSFIDILKIAKVNINKQERDSILHDLNVLELVEATYYGSFKVKYVNECSEVMLTIQSNGGMVEEYKKMKKKIKYCVDCQKPFEPNSNRQERCEDCAKKREREKTREYVRNYRNK